MALLSGSRLAAHTLQLTVGSAATLGQLFPAVQHIGRFNLRSDEARALLQNADAHVASVAIPYALATHEAFVVEMTDLIKNTGTTLITGGKAIKAWNMHTVFFGSCGWPEPLDVMEVFHVLREARNCVIHDRGRISPNLKLAVSAMGGVARIEWERLNQGEPPEALDQGDGRLALNAAHIFSSFAIAKKLGREINAALASHLSPANWAEMAVNDFAASTTRTRNSSQWRRAVLGHVREYYAQSGANEPDVEAAARALGYWTVPHWG